MLIKLEIFEILKQIRNIFSKMLTKIEIFDILNRNRNLFENCYQNRDFQNLEPKLIFFFEKCWTKSIFSKFWRCLPILRFRKKISFKIVTDIVILEIFDPKSKFFENVDRNKDVRIIAPNS